MRHAGAVRPVEDRQSRAIGLMLVAFLCFTGIDTSAKWLVTHGTPVAEVVFARYFGHLLLVLALAGPALGWRLTKSNKPWLAVGRGVFLMFSTGLNFMALQYLPLSLTISIFFTSPLIVCALSIPFLGETVGWRRWAAILAGFAGVLIVVRPGAGDVHWAVILSILATFCASTYLVLTRKAAGIDSTEVQQFYVSAIATVCLAPFAFYVWTWPQGMNWIPFLAIGVFGWTGHQCLTIAHRYAPASTLAPFVYLQILFMIASGWFFFHDLPDFWVLIGASVVMASGLYIWLRERQLAESG